MADDLPDTAAGLVRREAGRPRRTALERAVSIAHHAPFPTLAHGCVSQPVDLAAEAVDLLRALPEGAKRLVIVQLISKQR